MRETPCLDCGGAACVCGIEQKLRDANAALRDYETFLAHVETFKASESDPVAGIAVEGVFIPLSDPIMQAWLKACDRIDRRKAAK
jgi:hypothetical protein